MTSSTGGPADDGSSSDDPDQDTTPTAATSQSPQHLGFLGTGTIATALVRGLATSQQSTVPIASIAVSRRSESKSSALQAAFPNLVTVHDTNQDVVDHSDVVFVCVLPEQCSTVLRDLTFDRGGRHHVLCSLVSTSSLEGLAEDTGLSEGRVFKCICLPIVAEHEGVCLLAPKADHPVLLPLLDSLGGVVQAETEEQMSAMMVPSGLMGSVYGMMKQSRDWVARNGGVGKEDASYLVGRLFYGMVLDAERRCQEEEDAYEELIAEQTPGGLNEQALRNWERLGAMESLDKVQDALFKRITGESDGSIDK